MKKLNKIFLLLFIGFIACKSNTNSNNDKNAAINNDSLKTISDNNQDIIKYFSNFKNIYKFNDSINLNEIDRSKFQLMDTMLLDKYKMLKYFKDVESYNNIKFYNEADCRIIGFYHGYDNYVLILDYNSLNADDGRPKLQITTISIEGKFINEKELDIVYAHDGGYLPTQYLIINNINKFEFITNTIERVFKDEEMSELISETHKSKKNVFEIKDGIINQLK